MLAGREAEGMAAQSRQRGRGTWWLLPPTGAVLIALLLPSVLSFACCQHVSVLADLHWGSARRAMRLAALLLCSPPPLPTCLMADLAAGMPRHPRTASERVVSSKIGSRPLVRRTLRCKSLGRHISNVYHSLPRECAPVSCCLSSKADSAVRSKARIERFRAARLPDQARPHRSGTTAVA